MASAICVSTMSGGYTKIGSRKGAAISTPGHRPASSSHATRPLNPIRAAQQLQAGDSLQPSPSNNITIRKTSIKGWRMPSAEEIASLHLPALRCSFPSMLNPHYHQVKEECDAWIEVVAQPPSAAAASFLRACLLPCFVCRFIPQAPMGPRLLHAVKMIAWLMISDDDDDHPDLLGSDISSTTHRGERVMAILHAQQSQRPGGHLWQPGAPYLARLAALAELWKDIRDQMRPSLRARFISSMADYLEGLKIQATLRNELCIPDVVSYLEIRRQASFAILASILMEYALGIELDQATIENADMVELRNTGVDYLSICNDICSFPIEMSLGDNFNLPSILYACDTNSIGLSTTKMSAYSLQDIVGHVATITLNLNAHCAYLIDSLKKEHSKPTIDPTKTQIIHAYLDAIALGMSGAITWFLETPRYKKPCDRAQLY